MNKFSEAYKAAQDVIKNSEFSSVFDKLRLNKLKALMADDGPATGEASALDKLREALDLERRTLSSTTKGITPEKANAKAILNAAGSKPNKQPRAATLKMLKHFYHGLSAGGQTIWIYSPPKAYTKWIFDELDGVSESVAETVLAKAEEEVYSNTQRTVMCSAIQEARTVTLAVVAKLGTPDTATKEMVKQYFGISTTSDVKLTEIMNTLKGGYQKIANACNSSKIIISDEPIDRSGGGWKDWAFIYTTEAMKVIYLQGAWLSKADEITPSNQSPLYRCVRTIIHELSHKEVSTEDVVYGPKGLKPEGSGALTPDYALHNADSWAYFAVDVLGYLTGPDKSNGTKVNTAILKVPTKTLTVA